VGFRDGDILDVFLTHFAVPVVMGMVATRGILDQETTGELEGYARVADVEDLSVLVKTGVLTALAIGSSLTVDGVPYIARDVRREPPDGALTRAWLATS
jgi:hypothetical protein